MHTTHEHGAGQGHSHAGPQAEAPATAGRVIRWARSYDLGLRLMLLGQAGRLRAVPLDLAALRPGERVLDVGCGPGDLALDAARRVGASGTVTGIDASPEMIAVARGKVRRNGPGVQFQVAAVEAMPYADGSFDVVLSSLMIHHLPGDLKLHALAEIRRVLRPGGRVVIVDLQPPTRPPRPWDPGWLILRRHKMQAHSGAAAPPVKVTLSSLLEHVGFTAVESGPTRIVWLGYARGQAPG